MPEKKENMMEEAKDIISDIERLKELNRTPKDNGIDPELGYARYQEYR